MKFVLLIAHKYRNLVINFQLYFTEIMMRA